MHRKVGIGKENQIMGMGTELGDCGEVFFPPKGGGKA
jgi:hypothetical protein